MLKDKKIENTEIKTQGRYSSKLHRRMVQLAHELISNQRTEHLMSTPTIANLVSGINVVIKHLEVVKRDLFVLRLKTVKQILETQWVDSNIDVNEHVTTIFSITNNLRNVNEELDLLTQSKRRLFGELMVRLGMGRAQIC